jgi:hypothetical protein
MVSFVPATLAEALVRAVRTLLPIGLMLLAASSCGDSGAHVDAGTDAADTPDSGTPDGVDAGGDGDGDPGSIPDSEPVDGSDAGPDAHIDAGGDAGQECPPGEIECAGECVDIMSDSRHCGGCDRPCTGG